MVLAEHKVGHALAHLLRADLLRELGRQQASPKQLAAQLGEKLGSVSYHVRTLVSLGAIELVRTAQRRGALEHFYRIRMRAQIVTEEIPAAADGAGPD